MHIKRETIKSICIILPCYNPEINWEKNVVLDFKHIKNLLSNYSLNLVIVNDGSTKNVSEAAISFIKSEVTNFQFINNKINKGKGASIREGFKLIDNDFYIFSDIDFPYTLESFIEIVKGLEGGADIVSFVRDESYYNKIPWFRKLVSQLLRYSLKSFFQLPIEDTQAGLKGFSKQGKNLLLKTKVNRYLFDIELFKLAGKNKTIQIKTYKAQLREATVLAGVSLNLLLSEMKTLFQIWRM